MGKVVFIITTRDFPFNSNLFEDIKSNQLDEFVISDEKLLSEDDKKKCSIEATKQGKDKQTLFKQEKRTKVWDHEKASYKNSNYQESGLKVRKRTSIKKDNEFLIYIAPCTSNNGALYPDFKLLYTKTIIKIVNEDLKTPENEIILSRHLIAHDSDISNVAGFGVEPNINDYYSYKYQHIDKNPIYEEILRIIKEEDIFRNCENLYSMIHTLPKLSKLNLTEGNDGEDKVVKAYGKY